MDIRNKSPVGAGSKLWITCSLRPAQTPDRQRGGKRADRKGPGQKFKRAAQRANHCERRAEPRPAPGSLLRIGGGVGNEIGLQIMHCRAAEGEQQKDCDGIPDLRARGSAPCPQRCKPSGEINHACQDSCACDGREHAAQHDKRPTRRDDGQSGAPRPHQVRKQEGGRGELRGQNNLRRELFAVARVCR